MGHHKLPGRQGNRLADQRLVFPTSWAAKLFLLSIAIFTLASAICVLATRLCQLSMFRMIQGLCGGGLQPSSLGILIDSLPKEKQGTAPPSATAHRGS